MIHEVWNTKSRNLVASFEGEDAAIAFLRNAMREHGESYLSRLALTQEDRNGRSEMVATADALVERVRAQEGRAGAKAATLARPV